jgi:DNA-binding SARP family transcriptional activator
MTTGEVVFNVLGPWEVRVEGRPVTIPSGQLRAVLASLLLAANQPVAIETLADQIWPERLPARARGTLHTYVTRLRRLLGRDVIRTSPGSGYLLDAGEENVDLHRFHDLLRQANEATSPAIELARLHDALALWRGRPFGDVASTWLDRDVVPRLTEEWFSATERRIDLELAAGQQGKLIAELSELTSRYPTRESLWSRLITALHRAGRRAEALDCYRQLREVLREELGIDPSDQLAQLQRIVLLDGTNREPEIHEPQNPRQLPHDIANFSGRECELRALEALAADRPVDSHAPTIISIDGAPGTGKTTLAVHWAHCAAVRYPDAQLYLNLRGYGPGEPVTPSAAAATLLRGLGVVGDMIPPGLDERSALLRSTLAGRQALVVLDNARDSDQVRPLLPGTGSLVVVTSRNQLRGLSVRDGAHRVTLHPLPREQAVALLATSLGAHRLAAEPDATDRLVELCDRLPLALAIVAERAQRTETLAEVVGALGDEKARLDNLGTGEDDPQSDLRAALSWSYRTLVPGAAAMFHKLGLHPGNDIGLETAAALANLPRATAKAYLDQLVAAHLVEQRRPDRYEMHDLIRLYAMEVADVHETPAEREASVRRMLDWYLHAAVSADSALLPLRRRDFLKPYEPQIPPPAFETPQQATNWFEREYDSLRSVMAWAMEHGWAGHAWRNALAMTTFFDNNIPWTDGLEFLETAFRAAQTAGEHVGEGYVLNSLGCIHLDKGNWRTAESYLRQSLACFQEESDIPGEAMLRGNLGYVNAELGDYDNARRYSTRALELCEELGYQRGIAINLDNLGVALTMCGRPREAIECHERAHVINLGNGDAHSEASNQLGLGRAYTALGDTRKASAAFHSAASGFRLLRNRRWEAGALTYLGEVLRSAGHIALARQVWEEALVTLSEFGDPRADEIRTSLAIMQNGHARAG